MRHPDVYMVAHPPEPGFFVEDESPGRGLDWYRSLLADAGGAIALGERSTNYTKAPQLSGVPQRIRAVIPDVKLIYVIRDPVERIRSAYQHALLGGYETSRPIARALEENPSLLAVSRYAYQIEEFLKCFPRDQIMIVSAERFGAQPVATMHDVYRFIGVQPERAPCTPEYRLYRTADRLPLNRLGRWLNAHTDQNHLFERIPQRARTRLRHFVDIDQPERDWRIDDALEERLWSELGADLHRLRDIVGPDFDLWDRA